jgi:hypothetical protein
VTSQVEWRDVYGAQGAVPISLTCKFVFLKTTTALLGLGVRFGGCSNPLCVCVCVCVVLAFYGFSSCFHLFCYTCSFFPSFVRYIGLQPEWTPLSCSPPLSPSLSLSLSLVTTFQLPGFIFMSRFQTSQYRLLNGLPSGSSSQLPCLLVVLVLPKRALKGPV